jgi:hypothetical protein
MEPKSGEETAEEDESCYEESSSVSDEDDDDDDEEILMSRRSLLFLCQEGQIRIARQRLQSLKHANKMDRLKKEIFQVGRDKNYSLHEILMGGTSDTNAFAMTEEILDMGKSWKGPFLTMMNAQPPSHHRTSLGSLGKCYSSNPSCFGHGESRGFSSQRWDIPGTSNAPGSFSTIFWFRRSR